MSLQAMVSYGGDVEWDEVHIEIRRLLLSIEAVTSHTVINAFSFGLSRSI